MITATLVVGLASFWGWQALNIGGPLAPVRDLLLRPSWGHKLITCPFCCGFWLSLGLTALASPVLLDLLAWREVPLVVLAAAGVTGLLGSLLDLDPGDHDG